MSSYFTRLTICRVKEIKTNSDLHSHSLLVQLVPDASRHVFEDSDAARHQLQLLVLLLHDQLHTHTHRHWGWTLTVCVYHFHKILKRYSSYFQSKHLLLITNHVTIYFKETVMLFRSGETPQENTSTPPPLIKRCERARFFIFIHFLLKETDDLTQDVWRNSFIMRHHRKQKTRQLVLWLWK